MYRKTTKLCKDDLVGLIRPTHMDQNPKSPRKRNSYGYLGTTQVAEQPEEESF